MEHTASQARNQKVKHIIIIIVISCIFNQPVYAINSFLVTVLKIMFMLFYVSYWTIFMKYEN